jgi:hypothetical protein
MPGQPQSIANVDRLLTTSTVVQHIVQDIESFHKRALCFLSHGPLVIWQFSAAEVVKVSLVD